MRYGRCGTDVSVILSCALFFLAGCGPTPFSNFVSSPSPSVPSSPPSSVTHITDPSVYIVDDTSGPASTIDIFPLSATGPTTPTLETQGTYVSVDANGNVYALTGSAIVEYAANNLIGTPSRSLPVGAGTKIPQVKDVLASPTGEIYVSDGNGIAVFSATANGAVDPVRYIVGNSQAGGGSSTQIVPGVIALDQAGNLYVQDTASNSIAVFGPADTGTVVPKRTITYPIAPYLISMTTDSTGNLYVSCICFTLSHGYSAVGVLVFDATASGNTTPIRAIWGPLTGIATYYSGLGIAVDSAGTLYVSGGTDTGQQMVYVFAADANGNVAPEKTISYGSWTDSPNSRIAVH